MCWLNQVPPRGPQISDPRNGAGELYLSSRMMLGYHFRPTFRSSSGSQGPWQNKKKKRIGKKKKKAAYSASTITFYGPPSLDRRNPPRNACFRFKNILLRHVGSASSRRCRNFSGEKKPAVISTIEFFKATGLFPLGVPSISGGLFLLKLGMCHLPPPTLSHPLHTTSLTASHQARIINYDRLAY